jgi:hypothetical protein
MTDITFGTAPAPALKAGRTGEPNPFDGKFPTPIKDGVAQALTAVLNGDAKATEKAVTKLTGQARRAAQALETPMTARVSTKTEGTGKNAKTTVYVWTVDKITRKQGESAPASE